MSKIIATAPGNIMLMGEHSVLFGEPSLVCAVNHFIRVKLIPCKKKEISINSALGKYHCAISEFKQQSGLEFVIAAIEQYIPVLDTGLHLEIESDFSHKIGLGSSAAVTVAVIAVLAEYSGSDCSKQQLFEYGLKAMHRVQNGRGSGSDLAASLYGGVISYNINPREIRMLSGLPELSLFYAGYKTKTPEVLRRVEVLSQAYPDIYSDIYKLMGKVTRAAENAIINQDWSNLGYLMNRYHGLMDALGVSDLTLSEIVYKLRKSPRIKGAKISGSGLGDSVLALGQDPELSIDYDMIDVEVSQQGVNIEYQ